MVDASAFAVDVWATHSDGGRRISCWCVSVAASDSATAGADASGVGSNALIESPIGSMVTAARLGWPLSESTMSS